MVATRDAKGRTASVDKVGKSKIFGNELTQAAETVAGRRTLNMRRARRINCKRKGCERRERSMSRRSDVACLLYQRRKVVYSSGEEW